MDQETFLTEAGREYLCGYQLCLDMLNLRRYERRRKKPFGEEFSGEDILQGNEAFWRARLFEIEHLIASLRNGREKLILYYHYIRGESIERASDLLCISRRTGYRVHRRGLLTVGAVLLRENRITLPKDVE